MHTRVYLGQETVSCSGRYPPHLTYGGSLGPSISFSTLPFPSLLPFPFQIQTNCAGSVCNFVRTCAYSSVSGGAKNALVFNTQRITVC